MKIHEVMHICFLTHEYPPGVHGGIGSFTQTLARGLVKRGHRVTVVGNYPKDRACVENDQGVQIVCVTESPVPRTEFFVNSLRLTKAIREVHSKYPIDIIEGPELSFALLARSLPAIKVIRMHGGHHYLATAMGRKVRKRRGYLELRSFKKCDYVCAVSRYVAEVTRNLLHLGDRPIEILHNPVDTSFFVPRPDVPEENGLILFVGTVYEVKGIRQLVEAMPKIVSSVPNAHLKIVGREWFYPKTKKSFTGHLHTLINPEIEKHIQFTGVIDHSNLPVEIAKAQICVYPSLIEAMPVAWLEGLSVGKAVVASKTGPGPEIIEDGVSGLLCNPYDPKAIADKIIRLLMNPGLRTSLGKQAREHVKKKFSLEVIVDRNESFYENCLK